MVDFPRGNNKNMKAVGKKKKETKPRTKVAPKGEPASNPLSFPEKISYQAKHDGGLEWV